MAQKVHGGYTGKDEGLKSRGFIEQFGTWGFQSLRLDFQSLGLRSPAAAWGSCLVGPAELRRGTAGKMELEILRQRTVGRGIARGGEKTVNPNRKRRHDGIADSSTERVALTSKVNRFGKWSTFSENGKPKAANNGNDGQPKQERTRLKGLKGLKIKPFSHCCSDFQ